MFEAINSSPYSEINYIVKIPYHIPQRDKEDIHTITINEKLQGYLDDTTWLSENIKDLENNLKIADDFYNLANIKINKKKSKLLTNNVELTKTGTMTIQFGNDNIKIEF